MGRRAGLKTENRAAGCAATDAAPTGDARHRSGSGAVPPAYGDLAAAGWWRTAAGPAAQRARAGAAGRATPAVCARKRACAGVCAVWLGARSRAGRLPTRAALIVRSRNAHWHIGPPPHIMAPSSNGARALASPAPMYLRAPIGACSVCTVRANHPRRRCRCGSARGGFPRPHPPCCGAALAAAAAARASGHEDAARAGRRVSRTRARPRRSVRGRLSAVSMPLLLPVPVPLLLLLLASCTACASSCTLSGACAGPRLAPRRGTAPDRCVPTRAWPLLQARIKTTRP